MKQQRRRGAGVGSRRGRRRGAALLLTLLVLAILVVLVVQLSFSVKVEEAIVRNTEDDASMELAMRGGIHALAALFRDDKKNGQPSGAIDTLADIWCDPKTAEQRTFRVGEVTITLEVEDLERRLPLAWLADPKRKDLAEVALRRLIEKVQPVEGGDPAALAKAVAEKVRAIEGVTLDESGGASAPQGDAPRPRRFTSLDQLLDAPAAEGGEGGGGIDRRLLYGDPESDPPRTGLAPFVTTWPVPTVNVNSALPEVLFALLPEKNKADEGLWDEADAIVEGIRKFRIDPAYQQQASAPGSGGTTPAPAAGGEQGASRSWGGTAFTKVEELANAQIHAKLEKLFSQAGAAGGTTPPPGGGTTPPPPATGGEDKPIELKDLLTVQSRFYMIKLRCRKGDDAGAVEKAYRVMVYRGAGDQANALFLAEAPSR